MASYTVPLAGGGEMTVNASSEAAALDNVRAQGGTPSGGSPSTGGPGSTFNNTGTAYSPPAASGGGGGAQSVINPNDATAIQQAFGASSGFSIRQLEEQKREFDAQMAQAQAQMERIGIPQLEIQRRLADAQIAFQNAQMQQAQQNLALQEAQLTGYYTPYRQSPDQAAAGVQAIDPSAFYQQDAATQALYNQYHGANAAADWARDATEAVRSAVRQGAQNAPAAQPQQTLALGQLLGSLNGQQTEAAREFSQNLAEQQRQYNQNLALQYLTQASQFAATDPFQLSDFMRGAQASNANLPIFLQNLQNNVTGGTAGNVGPQPTAATTLPMLSQALQGQGQVNPQTQSALDAINGIYQRGASQLGTGTLESLGSNELNTLQQGISRLYGQPAAAAFLEQYKNTRPQQTAAKTSYY